MWVLIVNASASCEELLGVWRAWTVSWSWVLGLRNPFGVRCRFESHPLWVMIDVGEGMRSPRENKAGRENKQRGRSCMEEGYRGRRRSW